MTETQEKKKFDWPKTTFSINSLVTGFALLLCAFSLVLIAVRLDPLAKWANYQSLCVEEISSKYPIEYAVRKCNGRSKVYQVK